SNVFCANFICQFLLNLVGKKLGNNFIAYTWIFFGVRDIFNANYSPELLVGWVVGVPLVSAIIILILVRQMNRPLRRLQNAA
ncbi:hypothetical protein, partial [Acinetobacter baumannii]|uniref:hypothetical protein n=1 Tax=Acinetobacter baumannii TaxID=470 RepID=UPI001898539F